MAASLRDRIDALDSDSRAVVAWFAFMLADQLEDRADRRVARSYGAYALGVRLGVEVPTCHAPRPSGSL